MRRRGFKILANLGLMAASVALAVGAGEAAVRWLRPQFLVENAPLSPRFWRLSLGFYRHDPDLGWSHVPGARGVFTRREFSHHVSINSAGWRDRERTVEKPAGVHRIVALGDSFTWGHGVEDDEVFTRRLETMMPGVEALNMGLSGSSTDQQLLILKRHALDYDPDLVIVMVSRNDFQGIMSPSDGPYPKPYFDLRPGGALRLANVPVPEVAVSARLHDWARRHSALWNLTESYLERYQLPATAGPRERRQASYVLMRALLKAMRDAAAGTGAAFAVGIVPSNAHTYLNTIPPIESERLQALQAIGAAERIPILDLVPAFREAARDPATGARIDLHYRLDQHWNRLGHEVAAAELKRQILANRLLPGDTAL